MQKMQEMQVGSFGREYPLEEEMVNHFSILAWRISRTEEPSGLQSIMSKRVRHDSAQHSSTYIISTASELPGAPSWLVAAEPASCPLLSHTVAPEGHLCKAAGTWGRRGYSSSPLLGP